MRELILSRLPATWNLPSPSAVLEFFGIILEVYKSSSFISNLYYHPHHRSRPLIGVLYTWIFRGVELLPSFGRGEVINLDGGIIMKWLKITYTALDTFGLYQMTLLCGLHAQLEVLKQDYMLAYSLYSYK